jgi:hypothetical protein
MILLKRHYPKCYLAYSSVSLSLNATSINLHIYNSPSSAPTPTSPLSSIYSLNRKSQLNTLAIGLGAAALVILLLLLCQLRYWRRKVHRQRIRDALFDNGGMNEKDTMDEFDYSHFSMKPTVSPVRYHMDSMRIVIDSLQSASVAMVESRSRSEDCRADSASLAVVDSRSISEDTSDS